MLKALDHIIVAVDDLDSSALRWALMFGVQPVWEGVHPEHGTRNVLFNFGDFYLELMEAVGEGGHAERVRQFISKKGEGIFGVCCACDDIEAEAQAWRDGALGEVMVNNGEGVSTNKEKREWKLAIPSLDKTDGLFIFAIEHLSAPLRLSAPTSEGGIKSLDHVVIMTSNVEDVKSLLADKMKIRLALDHVRDDYGARQLFFRFDNYKTIEVAAPLKGDGVKSQFWGLAWQVDDIDATHARLTKSGAFNLSEVRVGRKKGTKVFTIRDAPSAIPTLIIAKA